MEDGERASSTKVPKETSGQGGEEAGRQGRKRERGDREKDLGSKEQQAAGSGEGGENERS